MVETVRETYRVEYNGRDGRFKGRDFDDLAAARLFYDSVGHADLLSFIKYVGYKFIARKN